MDLQGAGLAQVGGICMWAWKTVTLAFYRGNRVEYLFNLLGVPCSTSVP